LLEQLLSREVADVSAQMPESVEELRKVIEEQGKFIEDKDKQLEDKDKIIEDKGTEILALRKEKDTQIELLKNEIEELKEALLASKKGERPANQGS